VSPKVTTDESKGSGKNRYNVAQTKVRQQAARAVRILFTALAVILALGAILVVLRGNINEQNAIVQFITDVADAVSGPFSLNDGIFDFSGKNAAAKNALANWGIAAIVYLVIGRVLSNAIAPKSTK
jgi:hypothetical protein